MRGAQKLRWGEDGGLREREPGRRQSAQGPGRGGARAAKSPEATQSRAAAGHKGGREKVRGEQQGPKEASKEQRVGRVGEGRSGDRTSPGRGGRSWGAEEGSERGLGAQTRVSGRGPRTGSRGADAGLASGRNLPPCQGPTAAPPDRTDCRRHGARAPCAGRWESAPASWHRGVRPPRRT